MTDAISLLLIALYIFADQSQLTTQDSWATRYSNKTLDLSFMVRKNQTGHYITHWLVKNKSAKLPDVMKINVQSSTTEYGGTQSFNLHGVVTVPPPKPAGYELFPGIGYYKFYPDGAINFYQASATCTNEGGHLAIINSETENNVLKMLYARYPKATDWAFIGFHDMDVEGKYVTVFGNPLETTGFLQWHPGQPDQGGGNEDCGSMHRTGKLNDLWCDQHGPRPFICEYDLSWEEP